MKTRTMTLLSRKESQTGAPWGMCASTLVASMGLVACSGGGTGVSQPKDAGADGNAAGLPSPDSGVLDASNETGTALDGQSSTSCMATAKQGPLQGKLAGATCEYLGIHYGAPPTGALRFMPPQPAAAWQGTLDATTFGSVCEHPASGAQGSEDCLFLNVYTPEQPPATPLPVMAFIHGGGYALGSSNGYDAQSLSEAGPVVVVTMNYRLGALGFFALPELDAERAGSPSGSDGIRDQQLALKWIKDNAPLFGGDPNNLTIFGESAGSASACIHLVSPGSRGLARQFILESGSCVQGAPLLRPGTQADQYALSRELATALCPNASDGGSDVLTCLRAADPTAIMHWMPTSGQFAIWPLASGFAPLLGAPFYPTVEGAGGVLPDLPEKLIRAGAYEKTATIVAGTNAHEWGTFSVALGSSAPNLQVTTAAQLNQEIQGLFGNKAAQVEAQYPATDATASDVNVQLITDYGFRCPTRDLARLATTHGTDHFYLYSFEFGRAYHTDEVVTLFPNAGSGATMPTAALAKTMKDYWTAIAAGGDPNGATTPVMWPAYSATTDDHIVLNDPPVAGSHLDQANCDFWDSLNGYTTP